MNRKIEIAYVEYWDHYWFGDDMTKSEILRSIRPTNKNKGTLVCEVGFLIHECKEAVIIAHQKNLNESTIISPVTFTSTSKILKSDVKRLTKFKTNCT